MQREIATRSAGLGGVVAGLFVLKSFPTTGTVVLLFAALLMALAAKEEALVPCPYCAKPAKADASVCSFCSKSLQSARRYIKRDRLAA